MAVRESVEIDLDRVDRLIRSRRPSSSPSIVPRSRIREIARRHVAGGVASSWQAYQERDVAIHPARAGTGWPASVERPSFASVAASASADSGEASLEHEGRARDRLPEEGPDCRVRSPPAASFLLSGGEVELEKEEPGEIEHDLSRRARESLGPAQTPLDELADLLSRGVVSALLADGAEGRAHVRISGEHAPQASVRGP